MKKTLAFLLAVVMLMSLFPAAAFAENEPVTTTPAEEEPFIEEEIVDLIGMPEEEIYDETTEEPGEEPEEEPVEETYVTVTFDMNGNGAEIEAQAVVSGTPATEPEAPVAEGFVFTGWYTEPECEYLWVFDYPVVNDLSLYAGWAEEGTELAEPVLAEAPVLAAAIDENLGAGGNVAKIGETEYATLALAIEKAENDDTITMIADETLDASLDIQVTVTLDMNGKSITSTDSYAAALVVDYCTLTLIGSGSITTNSTPCIQTGSNCSIIIGDKDSTDAITFSGSCGFSAAGGVYIYNGKFSSISFCNDSTVYGGLFSAEPGSTYIPEGYECVTNTDASTSSTYPYKVQAIDTTDYLTFTSDSSFDVKLTKGADNTAEYSLQYSTDRKTWTDWDLSAVSAVKNTDNKYVIFFRNKEGSVNTAFASSDWIAVSTFSFENNSSGIAASGNIMTLLDYKNPDTATMGDYAFTYLFSGCTSLTTAPSLPATQLAKHCYSYMFENCKSLTAAPTLPAETMVENCYDSMFSGCSSLTVAPVLPATALANYCYMGMFYECSSLIAAPELKAEAMEQGCYQQMFSYCTSLTAAPALPATALANYCYSSMFQDCTSLTTAPVLPATALANYCYNCMFYGCTSLTAAPVLPATALADGCYSQMFYGCTSLTSAPELKATTLAARCYKQMFKGCTGLYVTKLDSAEGATWTIPAASGVTTPVSDMVTGTAAGGDAVAVPASGSNYYKVVPAYELKSAYTGLPAETTGGVTFTVKDTANADVAATTAAEGRTVTAIATELVGYISTLTAVDANGQTVSIAADGTFTMPAKPVTVTATYRVDTTDYLTFTADSAFNVALTKSGDAPIVYVQYSTDKTTWNDWTDVTAAVSAAKNTDNKYVISFRNGKDGENKTNPAFASGTGKYHYFTFTDTNGKTDADGGSVPKIAASGNIMTLLDYKNPDTFAMGDYAFAFLFTDCTSLTTAPTLPATTLVNYCYGFMFRGCTSLTAAPALPATALANHCYHSMFQGCTSLVAAPALPATTLADSCYFNMFNGCTSLTAAPELKAETMIGGCYCGMFSGCTSLISAPVLSATALASNCYNGMFSGCTSLTAAPALNATTLANNCYMNMFKGCTSLTAAPALNATTLAEMCYQQMFQNCTSLTAAPALNATTLAENCYSQMFYGCTSLISAPVLPATALANYCYKQMFMNCTSLTAAPELPATTLANNCYNSMFKGCTGLYVTKQDSAEGAAWTIPASGVSSPVLDMVTGTAAGGDAVALPASGSNYYKVVPAYELKSAYTGLPAETTGGVTFTVNDTAGAPVAATTAAEGRTVTAVATKVEGYAASLASDDVSVNDDSTFTMPAKPVTVKANYAASVVKIGDTEYASIEDAIKAASDGDTVKLVDDIELTSMIKVSSGKDFILDLNRHTLSGRNITDKTNASVIHICSGAKLKIINSAPVFTAAPADNKDSVLGDLPAGCITGGIGQGSTTKNGGAIYNEGTLIFEAGTVSGNSVSGLGGGIYNTGSLTLSGGVVENNSAGVNGGGIYNGGEMTVSGGSVTDNTLTVTGTPDNNVYLTSGKTVTIPTGGTAAGTEIGVSTADTPTAESYVVLTGSNDADYSGSFTSDNKLYKILDTEVSEENHVLRLVLNETTITVGKQTGTLIHGTAGSATFSVLYVGFNAAEQDVEWSGSAPEGVTASFGGTNKDTLTINTTEDTPVGEYTFTVTAKNGSDKVTSEKVKLTVVSMDISKASLSLVPDEFYYDGLPKYPVVWVSLGGEILDPLTDYTVEYSNNVNAGKATVTVKGAGSYTGTVKTTFTIHKGYQILAASASPKHIIAGETSQITAYGKKTSGKYTYSVKDETIATVNDTGLVTGVSEGTAIITVNAPGNANYNSASIEVKVGVNVIPEYTIDFVNYDGTPLQTLTVKEGVMPEYTADEPEREDTAQYSYTFTGWDKEIVPAEEDTTYTAQYDEALRYYTVTFENEDGSVLQSGEWAYGTNPVYSGAVPTKAATAKYFYQFAGWNPDVTTVTADAIYRAYYTEFVNSFTVSYDANGGTGAPNAQPKAYDVPVVISSVIPRKIGYTFLGWADSSTAKQAQYQPGDSYTANADITLYAVWMISLKTTKITVTPAKATLYLGESMTLKAKTEPFGASIYVSWKSSNTKIATVDENGVVTATGKTGSVTITATSTDGTKKSGKCTIKVVQPVEDLVIAAPQSAVVPGRNVQLKAVLKPANSGVKTVEWSFETNDRLRPYVTLKNGKLTVSKSMPAAYAGTVTVTATAIGCAEPISRSVSIDVTAAIASMTMYADGEMVSAKDKGALWLGESDSVQLRTLILPATACQSVTWKSSNAKVATVDENGFVTAHAKGTATITATSCDGAKKTVKYTIVVGVPAQSVTVSASKTSVKAGDSISPKATVLPKTASKTVRWELVTPTDMVTINEKTGKLTVSKSWNGEPAQVTVRAYANGTSRTDVFGEMTINIVSK